MGAGEACNVVAYAYAPAAVVTPLGGLSVLVAAVLAHALLGERLTRHGWLGCSLAVGGSAVVVLHAPREPAVASVVAIVARARAPPFVAFTLTALATAAYLAVVVDPRIGRRAPWVPVSICSLLGAVSVCGVKLVALAARLSLSGAGTQFASPAPWVAVLFTAAAVAIQLTYLNRALDAFPAALVTPLYYTLFTGGTLTAAACLYGGRVASVTDGVFLVAGLATVVTAVVLLHSTEGGGGGYRTAREAGLSGSDRAAREAGLSGSDRTAREVGLSVVA